MFLLALLIRLPGIGWGLKNDLHNASYHPDEPVIFGYSRAIVPGQGKFLPGKYNYGTLYLTLLRIASDVTSTYTGEPDPQTASHSDYWAWVSRCDMAGRLLSVLAGAGTAVVVLLIGRLCFGWVAGGIAGLLVAVAPAFVMHSRFQTVDVTATFFLACSLYCALRVAKESPPQAAKLAIWCGVFAGLSAGTKYTGILALLALYAALWLARPRDLLKSLSLGTVAAFLVFFLTTPGALFDRERFMDDFTFEMGHTATGHGVVFMATPSGFIYHLLNLGIGIDFLLVAIGLAGLAWAAYRRHSWAIVLLAFGIPYYILIARAEVKFIRYTFPLYIGVAAGCGYAMVAAHRRGGWARAVVGAGILGFGGLGGGGLTSTARMTVNMMGSDPRDQAAEYLRSAGGRVGLVLDPWFWTPPLYPDSANPPSRPIADRLAEMRAEARPPVDLVVNSDGSPSPWDPRLITDLHPDRIAFSSFQLFPVERLKYARTLDEEERAQATAPSKFLDLLPKEYDPDRTFGSEVGGWMIEELMPEDFLYVQPVVWVYKHR